MKSEHTSSVHKFRHGLSCPTADQAAKAREVMLVHTFLPARDGFFFKRNQRKKKRYQQKLHSYYTLRQIGLQQFPRKMKFMLN